MWGRGLAQRKNNKKNIKILRTVQHEMYAAHNIKVWINFITRWNPIPV
jgi:hypothetical protein